MVKRVVDEWAEGGMERAARGGEMMKRRAVGIDGPKVSEWSGTYLAGSPTWHTV